MFLRVLVLVLFASVAGCAKKPGKLMVDSPALPYQAPDISEITGIEEPDEEEAGEPSAGTGAAPAEGAQSKK
jgi:hypothetical protein